MGMPGIRNIQIQFFIFSRRPMATAASIVEGDFGPSPFFWQHVNVILTSARGNVKGKR
jgi:hypothetical protein